MADIPFDHTTTALDVATPAESERALAWTATVILVITLLLALFSAASMKSWAETLPPTPLNAVIRQSAEDWSDTTERLGLAAPRAQLHALWLSAKARRFGGAPGVQMQATSLESAQASSRASAQR
jgi:hypothetical protein